VLIGLKHKLHPCPTRLFRESKSFYEWSVPPAQNKGEITLAALPVGASRIPLLFIFHKFLTRALIMVVLPCSGKSFEHKKRIWEAWD
jgi:hypothetical protein